MDLQRNILIVALLVVSYLLFIAWQNDYNNPDNPVAQQAVQAGAPAAATPGTTTGTTVPANNDLAGLSAASSAVAPEVGVAPIITTSPRISVRTDVLDLQIDPNGGDIVDLRLPQYPSTQKTPEIPVQLLASDKLTYLAQSGLVGSSGPDLPTGQRAVYTSDAGSYQLADGTDKLDVVLHLPAKDGVAVEKIFRFTRGDYLVKVIYRVRNDGTAPYSAFLFGQLKRDGSGDPANPGGGSLLSASPSGLGPVYSNLPEEKYTKISFDDIVEKPLDQSVKGGWIGFIQHYFVAAWVPVQDVDNKYFARKASDGNYLFGFTTPQVQVAPGTQQEIATSLYAGPKLQDRLAELSPGLDLTVDYGWFWMISQPLLWLLVQIELLVGNWGIAIILLTVLVKVLFYYPSQMSYRSMAHLRRVTPELTRIREQYKDDRQKQAQEMMNLYKKEKINPLGGCLPILLQMPVFIALYWVLLESVELRQAPFMLWITDLSVKDPYFILPILMGISMWLQTKLNPAPPDPMQAKMMQWLPWIFTVFFLFFASGLVLYWLVNNILSIAQQWYITRQIEKQYGKT